MSLAASIPDLILAGNKGDDLPLNDNGVCTVEGVISFSFLSFKNHFETRLNDLQKTS